MTDKQAAMRFARALINIMDGMKEHDIQRETGLTKAEAAELMMDRLDARIYLNKVAEETMENLLTR